MRQGAGIPKTSSEQVCSTLSVMGEAGPCSSTSEYRLALFNKGAARFAVIFRLTTMDVVGSLEV
jgi:hypothetical protein